ncbi:hypothetical protein DM558_02630 [Entomomonas moraniae]|uniref:DUF4279 domain-containing protein n=1 Tax=Entomomonas moraniae TaxID=2213226 RepID=A0A3S9XBE0_9GAMM|nr:hypothetical protein [Entomomonas moraniae]AZS49743.1 hypothetical protein DM558_02630 [Entomomonas moraniae]
MTTQENCTTSFINLDLELLSPFDLSPIKDYWGTSVFPLTCDFFERNFYLCVEPVFNENESCTVYHCTEIMLNVLEQLPTEHKILLDSCTSCVFDYGFDIGANDSPPFQVELTPIQLTRIAALNITVRVTIYSYSHDD